MTQKQMQHSQQQMQALEEEMKAAGAWLFSGRLTEPDVATVVRVSAGGDALTTDGPFVESKEHLAGFYIINADDLDAALGWATRTAAIIGMPIEVRTDHVIRLMRHLIPTESIMLSPSRDPSSPSVSLDPLGRGSWPPGPPSWRRLSPNTAHHRRAR
jgi:hypothetical protein